MAYAHSQISERAVPKLSKFIRSYDSYIHDLIDRAKRGGSIRFRPTKIALIDNGILSISAKTDNLHDAPLDEWHFDDSLDSTILQKESAMPKGKDDRYNNSSTKPQEQKDAKNNKTLWSRIKDGCSFVDDDSRLSSWLFASNPHGTQMANLICAIDPCCDLYVAKVTEGRYDIKPDRVAKAIQWAIDQNVDIISMSFATLDKTDALQKVCEKAVDSGIALICSIHDQGANISRAYPVSFRDVIRIMACDESGAPARNVKAQYNYGIHGIDVAAGVVPFLESDDRISGSSVATAIAAGLASLTLSCDRLANGRAVERISRRWQARNYKRAL
ncbi:hypothetical protein ACHAPE_004560 [Trichoderma viride]